MKHSILICILFMALTTNAQADFSAGLDAYTKKDYRTALKEFQMSADRGNADAQFMLGYMYASGKGVIQDYTRAHVWFNLSAARGHEKAGASRDKIAQVMTHQQIAEAQKLAREWQPVKAPESQPAEGAASSDTVIPSGTERIRLIQANLTELGYDPGPADGKMGSRTRDAIREYQKQAGLWIDGEPSQSLLEHLQKERESRPAEKKTTKTVVASPSSEPTTGIKDAPEEQTQEVIDQLKKIVKKGEEEKRADTHFLAELHELIRRYDWPWRNRLFHDDFTDGNLTRNPSWIIASGDFYIDSYQRLVTRFSSPQQKRESQSDREEEDTGSRIFKSILTEILKDKDEETRSPAQPLKAEIYSVRNISNAFSMDIELTMLAGGHKARLEIGTYKGRQREEGYRLNYVGGQTPMLELARHTSRGSSIIEISRSVSIFADGRPHVVRWQRHADGNMVVAVDEEAVIRTMDRTFQDPFDGILIANHNGHFAVSFVNLFGEKE